jgi:hypothetical protein
MHARMAFSAQRDQVVFLIAAGLAAKLKVVYLQILHTAADLAAPAVALQYPTM